MAGPQGTGALLASIEEQASAGKLNRTSQSINSLSDRSSLQLTLLKLFLTTNTESLFTRIHSVAASQ